MSDRTQEIKNLRAVATACKNYTDKVAKDLQWQLGTYDLGVETVNGTTSLLPSPSGTIQATMVRVDGASEVMVNDFDSNLTSISDDTGVTHSKVGNSYVIVNSSSSSSRIVLNTNLNGKHTIAFDSDTAISYGFRINSLSLQNNIVVGKNIFEDIVFTGNNPISIYVPANSTVTISNIVSTTNYFTGIHNLELSGLKVEGQNLFDKTAVTLDKILNATTGVISNDNNSFVSDYVEVIEGATYNYNLGVQFGTAFYDSNKTYLSGSAYTTTFTIPSGAKYIRMSAYKTRLDTLMISKGSTIPTTYQPYITPTTKTIDLSTILYNGSPLFEGKLRYGDYVTPYKAHKQRKAYTFTGNETITLASTTSGIYGFYISVIDSDIWTPENNSTSCDGKVFVDFEIVNYTTANGIVGGLRNGIAINTTKTIVIAINGITTESAMTTFLTGKTIEYDINNPIEVSIDFSQLVKFEAHSNGSITLVNTNNQDTTSTFKYLKEVAK